MVLVTGATGLLGSHLLYFLLRLAGYNEVYALRRRDSRLGEVQEIFRQSRADDLWERIHWVEGDICNPETFESILAKVNFVYHCAAVVSFSEGDRERLWNTNLEGTEHIAQLCLKYKVRLCYVSSIAALGDARYEGEIINEETPVIAERIHSVYSQSKQAAEHIIWKYAEKGLDVVIVNPSIILGTGHWERSSSQLFRTVVKGMPFYTNGVSGYVDVRDVCRVMVYLAENRRIRGERFVVNGGNYSFRKLFVVIAEEAGLRAPFIHLRPWMSACIWRLLVVGGRITGKKPSFTRETARSSQHKSYYSSVKLLAQYPELSFRSLDETVQDMYRSYLSYQQSQGKFLSEDVPEEQ